MEEKLSIKVNVADRYYPLKIDRKDEEKIRRAAKQINDKVLLYKKRYLEKDVQDFLAMAALQFVTKVIELEENNQSNTLMEEVEKINQELEEYTGKE
jgi:cell division protein ZapA